MKQYPIKRGQLFTTTAEWDAFQMNVNPHGIWVPKQQENTYLIHPSVRTIKSIIPPETPAMYIGTDGRPHVGMFLVGDTFYELPYNILKEINNNDNS